MHRTPAVALALLLFALLLLTNRWATMARDARLVQSCCPDSFAYRDMARAFPALPDESRDISFHHAQRFLMPWLAGGLARTTGLSIDGGFRALSLGLALGVVLLTLVLLGHSGVNATTQTGLLTLFVFNAYAFRFDLAFPWYVNDLAFVLGLVVMLLGLARGTAVGVLTGIAIAAVSRQTTLLVLPSLLAWLAFDGQPFTRRTRIALAVACPVLAIGAYLGTGRVAATFATASTNLEKISGIFGWLAHDFSAGDLVPFAARMLLPLLPLILLGGALVALNGSRLRIDVRCWLLASLTVAIAAQPALGGPDITAGNAQRLTMLGFVPLLLALAHLMAINNVELTNRPRFWLIFGTAAFVMSLHHIHSVIGQSDSDLALTFAISFTLASLAVAVAAWASWRRRTVDMPVSVASSRGARR